MVVFLRPIEELIQSYNNTDTLDSSSDNQSLFAGITSTSKFVGPNADMNGADDSNLGGQDAAALAGSNGGEKSLFDSPSGGGMTFGEPTENPFGTGLVAEESGIKPGDVSFGSEQFKQASPSLFEQSLNSSSEVQEVRARGGSTEEVDFMANQEQNWIQQQVAGALKGDSGFLAGWRIFHPSTEQPTI